MANNKNDRQPTQIGQLPEFRYNHRRKHYSYIFGRNKKGYRNLLITSKPKMSRNRDGRMVEYDNVRLYRHPNPNANSDAYLINKVYVDKEQSFDVRTRAWRFHPFDRRKVKKVRKGKWPK